jgi:hypothetical protein
MDSRGLCHSSRALTSRYHFEYLDVVGEVWAGADLGRATGFAVHGYGSLFVDPATAADAWLAQPGWPELLRRLVRAGRDAQARAPGRLACRPRLWGSDSFCRCRRSELVGGIRCGAQHMV